MNQTALEGYEHVFTFFKSRMILFPSQISQSKMKYVRKAFLSNITNSGWDCANSQMFALFFCKRSGHQRPWLGPLQKPHERSTFPTPLVLWACTGLDLPNRMWTKATPVMFYVCNSHYVSATTRKNSDHSYHRFLPPSFIWEERGVCTETGSWHQVSHSIVLNLSSGNILFHWTWSLTDAARLAAMELQNLLSLPRK